MFGPVITKHRVPFADKSTLLPPVITIAVIHAAPCHPSSPLPVRRVCAMRGGPVGYARHGQGGLKGRVTTVNQAQLRKTAEMGYA